MVKATMAESELLANLTQPTPTTLTHEFRFWLMAQSALIFLPLTQTDAPIPPSAAAAALSAAARAEAGGSAVGAATTSDALLPEPETWDNSCGTSSDMMDFP